MFLDAPPKPRTGSKADFQKVKGLKTPEDGIKRLWHRQIGHCQLGRGSGGGLARFGPNCHHCWQHAAVPVWQVAEAHTTKWPVAPRGFRTVRPIDLFTGPRGSILFTEDKSRLSSSRQNPYSDVTSWQYLRDIVCLKIYFSNWYTFRQVKSENISVAE